MKSIPDEDIIQVLIIEDDPRIAEINRRFVEKVDHYQVIGIATDQTQAQEQISILHPDLVLLDVYFPDMNGLSLLKYIKQCDSETDVIMITAAKEVNAVKDAIRHGVFDFIVKPVIFERFQETLINFREFRKKLKKLQVENQKVNQEDIDSLMKINEFRANERKFVPSLPKGIDKLTLTKISSIVHHANEGLTADQVGQFTGCSRTTARRYLEYLVAQGDAAADLSYGIVGRPERIYRRMY
jgi:two-component system CitB family response regulator